MSVFAEVEEGKVSLFVRDRGRGFNPLAVDAPADVIADYVVAALKNLFTDADVILRPL